MPTLLDGVALVALGAAATLGLSAFFLGFTPIAMQVVPYLLVAVVGLYKLNPVDPQL